MASSGDCARSRSTSRSASGEEKRGEKRTVANLLRRKAPFIQPNRTTQCSTISSTSGTQICVSASVPECMYLFAWIGCHRTVIKLANFARLLRNRQRSSQSKLLRRCVSHLFLCLQELSVPRANVQGHVADPPLVVLDSLFVAFPRLLVVEVTRDTRILLFLHNVGDQDVRTRRKNQG